MFYKKKNIFDNLDFNTLYPKLGEVIKLALEKYWELDVSIILQAVNDYREVRDEHLVKNLDFFSNQIKVEKHKPIVIRFSKDFADDFLSATLYDKTRNGSQEFKLTDLTQLEIKILNNFSEFLYKRLKEVLIPVSELKLSEKSEKYYNYLFMLGLSGDKCSKILISIPQDRIKTELLEVKNSFSDEDFLTSNTKVKIKAGNTKITLEELKNLAVDDIVVLENSNSSKLTLISGELERKFKVKVNPSLILDLGEGYNGDNNNEIYDEVTMEKNLWDDIQIELSAEFEKVKMTIGELKQITTGQIVDLGSVFNSEISLFVEDKKVAKGDLIIVNDHYAVKLNEVLSSDVKKKATPTAPATPPPPAQGQAKPAAKPAQAAPTQAKPAQAQAASAPKQAAQGAPPAQKPAAQAPKPAPAKETKHQVAQDEEFDYSDFEK